MDSSSKDGVVEDFIALYNRRDLILYALSIGFGADENEKKKELRYLYEGHFDFDAVATFCLAVPFWASKNPQDATLYEIPPSPPVAMQTIIPCQNLRAGAGKRLSGFPRVHIWQSITWNRKIPVPGKGKNAKQVSLRLERRTLSILPKSIGTFVTDETQIHENMTGHPLCTLQSTTLLLGMPQQDVKPRPGSSGSRAVKIPKDQKPTFQWAFTTSQIQALLYRLASGDSNNLHVMADRNMSKLLGLSGNNDKPILHGLCTLGIASRAIIQYVDDTMASFARLEGRFAKPVFIGDTLLIKLWEVTKNMRKSERENVLVREFLFVVLNETTGECAIDNGSATLYLPSTFSRL